MTLRDNIQPGNRTIILEVAPPRGVNIGDILQGLIPLKDYIQAISVPENPRGRARMDSLAFGHILMEKTGKEVVLHITCRDKNIIALQSELLGAYALGIKNLLLLTGDPPSQGDYPSAKAVFDTTSEGLIGIANKMREGYDLTGRDIGGKLDFFLGAGFNPFAPEKEKELERTLKKVALGVDFLVSQPLFSQEKWEEFLNDLKVEVFLIGGVWVMKSLRMANFLRYEVPGIVIPDEIMERMEKASDEREEGLRIAIEMVNYLLKKNYGVMLMTGNDFELAKELMEEIL